MSVKKINGKLVLVHYAASEYVLREESLAHVVLVVVDETRHYARQDGRGGERERVLQAVEDVLERRVDLYRGRTATARLILLGEVEEEIP